ncbi:helix-turn-helix domain-containing protein [Streptomyces microflavus]
MAGLSCEQLAMLAGVSPETVRRAEKGKSQPSGRVAKALADALSCQVEELAPTGAQLTLKELRQRQGGTQRDLAARIGVSTQMVSRVENGVYGVREPNRWAAAYGVSRAQWGAAWAASKEDRRRRIRAQPSEGKTP